MTRSTLRYAPRYTGDAKILNDGAGTRIRTTDFLITNEALYQLSYTGFLLFSAKQFITYCFFWANLLHYE